MTRTFIVRVVGKPEVIQKRASRSDLNREVGLSEDLLTTAGGSRANRRPPTWTNTGFTPCPLFPFYKSWI